MVTGVQTCALPICFAISALEVGLGELVICVGLGIPFYLAIEKNGLFKRKPGNDDKL